MAWLKDGCVLWLQFDEEKGDVAYDQSGEGNNGVIHGATRVKGKIGGALSFNGVGDYVKVSASDSLSFKSALNQEISLAYWVYWIPIGTAGCDRLTGFTDYRFETAVNEDTGELRFYTPQTSWINTGKCLKEAVWAFLVWTYPIADKKWRLYVNKVLEYTCPSAYEIDIYRDFYISSRLGTGEFTKGLRDEVRIYNRALSAKEIFSYYMYALTHVKRA